MSDLDFDHTPGLPEPLPAGERLLWQGKPEWKTLAFTAFRLREVSVYFAAIAVWRVCSALFFGETLQVALISAAWVVPMVVLALTLLTVLAWLTARTTIYSVTDKRVVMRIGVALPLTLNLPFGAIESAALGRHANGCGDIPLTLSKGGFGYLVLWPHARPWQFKRPQPMLRSLPDAERVAMLIGEGLRAVHVEATAEVVKQPQQRGMRAVQGSQPALAS